VLVRQRPGSAKGVIFMTLEDETGVANVIVWPKVFERYRALVLGSRLVRVTGKLQNEMGVIHVVADRVEDLTPLLADIETEGIGDEGLANADEVRRPVIEIREKLKPRSRLAQLLKEAPHLRTDYETLKRSEASARVLPKGRNFH
jgi:error-prone DNA polymerase